MKEKLLKAAKVFAKAQKFGQQRVLEGLVANQNQCLKLGWIYNLSAAGNHEYITIPKEVIFSSFMQYHRHSTRTMCRTHYMVLESKNMS